MLAMVIIELILSLVWLFFCAWRNSEKWNKIVRFSIATILMGLNIFRIPMHVQMNEAYAMTMVRVFGWFILAVICAMAIAFKKGREG